MKEKGTKNISTVFWFLVLFYLDPGGFIRAYASPIERSIFYFLILILAFLLWRVSFIINRINIFNLRYVRYYTILIFLWNIYYFMIFLGYNNNEELPSFIALIFRNFTMVFNSLIVFPIIYFYFLGIDRFVELLLYTTIIIGLGFIITVLAKIPFIPIWEIQRNQVANTTRVLMYGYGLMNFIIPFTIANHFFHIKIHKRLIISFIIVLSIMLITIYRRDMVAVIEYVLIISVLSVFIEKRKLIKSVFKFLNFRMFFIIISFFLVIYIYKPSVIKTGDVLLSNTLIELGLSEKKNGFSKKKDVRMSLLENINIVNAIRNNFYFGTGYDKDWYEGDGGRKGWEGSDYVFLATFGMYGIIGLLSFLPFYLLVFSVIILFLRLIRNNLGRIYKDSQLILSLLIGVSVISEFIKNLIEYPNWFYPIGAIMDRGKYFIFFGLLIGSFYHIKIELSKKCFES